MGTQVVIIDTMGNWWGLRVDKDGKGPGIQIPVIGGDHGDLPITERRSRTVAQTTTPMVIDVSDFSDGEFAKIIAQKWAIDVKVLGDYERLPQGDALRQYLMGDRSRLSGMEKRLLDAACMFFPNPVGKTKVREVAGGYASSGPVSSAFAKLRALGYLLPSGANNVIASKDLFG